MRAIRHAKDLTVQDLARAIGVSESYLYKLEWGKVDPSAAAIMRISGFLECSADDLLGRKE